MDERITDYLYAMYIPKSPVERAWFTAAYLIDGNSVLRHGARSSRPLRLSQVDRFKVLAFEKLDFWIGQVLGAEDGGAEKIRRGVVEDAEKLFQGIRDDARARGYLVEGDELNRIIALSRLPSPSGD